MKDKRIDYEILRLLAIVGVVFNHTQSRGFELYMVENCSTVNYVGSLLLGILCKMAVPLFFLVSGGLLLHRQEPVTTVLKKRVLRILIVLVLFSGLLYLCWIRWGTVEDPGVGDFFRRLWANGISIPYWYLYTYLGLMLLLPFLRPMVQGMGSMAFLYLIGLHILFYGVLSTLGLVCRLGPVNPDLWVPMVEPDLFYFIMGYYLAHRFPWELVKKRQLVLAGVLGIAAVAGMLVLADLDFGRNGMVTMNFLESLLIFPIFFVYALVHQICAWHPVPLRAGKIIAALGSCVFGAYLLEGILRHELGFVYELLEPKLHVLPACMIWVLAVVLAGLAITWVLKKVPGLKKLL